VNNSRYTLTDEHRAQLKPWAERWIATALSTVPLSDKERATSEDAARQLYKAAGLEEPRIVWARGPITGAIAACIAAGVWWLRRNPGRHLGLFGKQLSERDLMEAIAPACAIAVQYGLKALWGDPVNGDGVQAADETGRDVMKDAVKGFDKNLAEHSAKVFTYDAMDAAEKKALQDLAEALNWDASTATYDALTATYDSAFNSTEHDTKVATEATACTETLGAMYNVDNVTFMVSIATIDQAAEIIMKGMKDAAGDTIRSAARDIVNSSARDAMYDIMRNMYDATKNATQALAHAGVHDVTYNDTRGATYEAVRDAAQDITEFLDSEAVRVTPEASVVRFLIRCITCWWRMWNGGNQWCADVAFLSFFRHIAKLDIDYSKWEPYETLATIGPRLLHKEFCILSELPEVLVTDENNRPHCADGPSHRWRDGFALYYWHGIRVPRRLIEAPETYTAAEIKAETNSEIHRVFAERLGWDRYLELRGFRVLDTWTDPRTGLCYELLEPETRVGEFEPRYLRMQSPPLHDGSQPYYIEPVSPELKTAQAARKWQIQLSTHPDARYYRHGDVVITYAPPETLYWPHPEECNSDPYLEFVQEA